MFEVPVSNYNWHGLTRTIYEPQHEKKNTHNKMACAPSEDSDQPGHPPSLIRVFAVRMKKPWVLSYPLSAQRRLWSDWADAQADLSLRWAHMRFYWFCHEAAQSLRTTSRVLHRALDSRYLDYSRPPALSEQSDIAVYSYINQLICRHFDIKGKYCYKVWTGVDMETLKRRSMDRETLVKRGVGRGGL